MRLPFNMIRSHYLLVSVVTVFLLFIGFGFNSYQNLKEHLRISVKQYDQLKEQSVAMMAKIKDLGDAKNSLEKKLVAEVKQHTQTMEDLLKDRKSKGEECSKEKEEARKHIEAAKENTIRAESELAKVVASHASLQTELQSCHEAAEDAKSNAALDLEQCNRTCAIERELVVESCSLEHKRIQHEWDADRKHLQHCLAGHGTLQKDHNVQADHHKEPGPHPDKPLHNEVLPGEAAVHSRGRRQAVSANDHNDQIAPPKTLHGSPDHQVHQVAPLHMVSVQSEHLAHKTVSPQKPHDGQLNRLHEHANPVGAKSNHSEHSVQKHVPPPVHHMNNLGETDAKVVKQISSTGHPYPVGPPLKPGVQYAKKNNKYPELDSEQFMFEGRFGPAVPVNKPKVKGHAPVEPKKPGVVGKAVDKAMDKAKQDNLYDVERD